MRVLRGWTPTTATRVHKMKEFQIVAREINRDAVDALLWAWSGVFEQTPALYTDAERQAFTVACRSVANDIDPEAALLAVTGPYQMPVDAYAIEAAQALIRSGEVVIHIEADLAALGLTSSPVVADDPPVLEA